MLPPPFPLARGQGHERTGRVRLPFLKDIGDHGLGTLRHELCDLATQDGAGDPGVITHPDRRAGREPLFGNLPTTDEKQQTRSAVNNDAVTPQEMVQRLGAHERPFYDKITQQSNVKTHKAEGILERESLPLGVLG